MVGRTKPCSYVATFAGNFLRLKNGQCHNVRSAKSLVQIAGPKG